MKMQKNMVRISTQDILDVYVIGKVIGEGIFLLFISYFLIGT